MPHVSRYSVTTILMGLSSLVVLGGCAVSSAPETSESMASDEIADSVMAWWPGDYDNNRQIADLRADGAPIWKEGQHEDGQQFGGHLPVTSYYRVVSMPNFGDRVLYLEEFTFGDNPYRQRIYTIEIDDADRVRVKLWYFPDKTTYAGAWKDLTMIADLSPDDMSPLPDNCDLIVEPADDGRLHMMMPKDQCQFGASIFDYQVSLSADDFWFRDRIVDAETMEVSMTAGSFTYHKLDRFGE